MAARKDNRTARRIQIDPAESPPRIAAGTLAAVALLSGVGLAWEIVLTRLASATLSYHYAFVVVSLAVGGLGIGAAIVCAGSGDWGSRMAPWWAGISAVALLAVPPLLSPLVAHASLGAMFLLGLPPFIAIGAAVTSVFRSLPRVAPTVYAADLVGAGVGALGAVAGMNAFGPLGLVFLLAAFCGVCAWLLHVSAAGASGRFVWKPLGLTVPVVLVSVAGVVGLVAQAQTSAFGVDYRQMANAPPDKTIVPVLRDPSNNARIINTHWDAFARTDVVATADPTQRLIFTDGGAGTYMQQWNGRIGSQTSLRSDLETLPFLLGAHKNVLIIGSGGGIDVLRALVAGAKHVTAVDWNADAVRAVRQERTYDGNLLGRPNVTTVVDDARHFLARDSHKYDTILLNLVYTGAAQGTANALAENYVFTTQAFQEYLGHLTSHGRVGIISHQALEGLRAFTTGIEALHQQGYSYAEALQRAALLMTDNQTPESRPTITIVQSAPFNGHELTYLRTRGTGDLNLRPLYVPDFYQGAFSAMVSGTMSLSQFLQGQDYAVNPTSDDRPFFFDLNLGLPEGMSDAIRYSALLLLVIVVGALSLRSARGTSDTATSGPLWLLCVYTALLGAGFMGIELPLIQRFILVLGEPTTALVAVLATLLVAGGLGSLTAGRLYDAGVSPIWPPLAVAGAALLLRVFIDPIQSTLLTLPFPGAIAGSVLTLAPIGFVLGMPFPLGLSVAARIAPDSIPLLWTVSAGFSMLGSVLAALIAIEWGFSAVLLGAAALYTVGAAAMYLASGRVSRPVQSTRKAASVADVKTPVW